MQLLMVACVVLTQVICILLPLYMCSFHSSQVLLPYVKATCDDFYEELRTKADAGLPHMSVSVMVVCACVHACVHACMCACLICV